MWNVRRFGHGRFGQPKGYSLTFWPNSVSDILGPINPNTIICLSIVGIEEIVYHYIHRKIAFLRKISSNNCLISLINMNHFDMIMVLNNIEIESSCNMSLFIIIIFFFNVANCSK